MIMWVDVRPRHPALAAHDGGLRRPHASAWSTPDGKSTFVKFHWRPKLGSQSVVWDEARQDQRRRSRLHRRDLWEAIESGDFPEWELGGAAVRRGLRRRVRLRRARRDQDHPRGADPAADRRQDGARPQPGQFLRRDRAGRVLHRRRRAGDRLHQRSAAAGPPFSYLDTQLKRLGGPNFHADPGQRAEVPDAQFPARRAHADAHPQGPRRTTSRTRSTPVGPREDPTRGFRSFAAHDDGRQAARPRRNRSPTITARRGCSSSARPSPSRTTSSRR